MNSYFLDKVMPYIQQVEGGFYQDPLGGPTYCGITARTLLRYIGINSGSNTNWDVKQLVDKPELILAMYLSMYWLPIRGYELAPKTAVVMFDGCVQHGPVAMIHFLQRAVSVNSDGMFGNDTLAAVNAYIAHTGDETLATFLLTMRLKFYQSLNQTQFITGWINRLEILAKTFNINWSPDVS